MIRLITALLLATAITTFSRSWFDVRLPFWGPVVIYLGLYWLLGFWPNKIDGEEDQPHPRVSEFPLPEPGAAGGAWLYVGRYTVSALASIFNPLQLWQQLQQLGGQAAAEARYFRKKKPDITDYQSTVRYTLPFRDTWCVINGGVTPATSHSWGLLTQRYAYDFVRLADGLQRHSGDGYQLADYGCYDEPIVAAAAGTVVAVRDGIRDWPWPGRGWVDLFCRDFRGNYVVIQHAEKEYTFYAHLIPGSLKVAVDDVIERGAVIGRCGNSGHSTEPHLHFHLQDTPSFFTGVGLPIRFSDVLADEEPFNGWLQAGHIVRSIT
ncbi:MAG: M23 family metallopeptidase [Ardenticatenaceae bacterium]|nr:M23 family metallopeptidase [Ardenticatenaceae bacterium]